MPTYGLRFTPAPRELNPLPYQAAASRVGPPYSTPLIMAPVAFACGAQIARFSTILQPGGLLVPSAAVAALVPIHFQSTHQTHKNKQVGLRGVLLTPLPMLSSIFVTGPTHGPHFSGYC